MRGKDIKAGKCEVGQEGARQCKAGILWNGQARPGTARHGQAGNLGSGRDR